MLFTNNYQIFWVLIFLAMIYIVYARVFNFPKTVLEIFAHLFTFEKKIFLSILF